MVQVLDEWLKTDIFKSMGKFVLSNIDKELKWPPNRRPKWGTNKISDLESFEAMREKYSENFKEIPEVDVSTNIFKAGGMPIALMVPIFSPSFEYPQGALP